MREKIIKVLEEVVGSKTPIELSVPEEPHFGHYATNVAMRLAKARNMVPLDLAKKLAHEIIEKEPEGFFEKVEAVPPGFVNFWVSKAVLQNELQEISRTKDYGKGTIPKKKTVIVEYSSPNIAKVMHVGHLRNTIIGDALANILAFSGYEVVRWNYFSDWGTQFGKLIAAYKLWGKKEEIEKNPIEELQKLYVRFHEEAKADPDIEKRGQEEFKKLEEGDKENRKIWEWFKEESLKEFKNIYQALGVDFDVWIGEGFFAGEMKSVVANLLQKKIAKRSEGTIIAKLDEEGLPPALVEKSDGASLYLTRDIANLEYRLKKYKPVKILYVVGNEQSLHFEQLFAIAKKLGLDSAELMHIKYGLVLAGTGKKFSSREGKTEPLTGILREAREKARHVLEKKNPDLAVSEKEVITEAVALAALKYNDLKENRMTDIVFDWEKMLDFVGDSAPYLLYTYARLMSIVRKAGENIGQHDVRLLAEENELALMRRIFEFPDVVRRAGELYSTSILATYLYKLAVVANKFYETTPILKDGNAPRRTARLLLVQTAADVLQSGLGLLGIQTLEKI